MWVRFIGKRAIYGAVFPFVANTSDNVSKETKTAESADRSVLLHETGRERLARMFTIDEFDNLSPELASVVQVGCMSIFVGILYGGILHSRTAYMDFVKNNQATMFKDHLEAKKRLQDKVSLSFAKGAFRWGWRLSAFSTSYVGISTMISVYRGKTGIIEHIIAGSVAGFGYKFTAGPRAWVVGGGLGCVLGLIAGTLTHSLLTLSGTSMEDVRYWQYKWKETRMGHFKQAVENQMEKDALFLLHDKKVRTSESFEDLVTIDSAVK